MVVSKSRVLQSMHPCGAATCKTDSWCLESLKSRHGLEAAADCQNLRSHLYIDVGLCVFHVIRCDLLCRPTCFLSISWTNVLMLGHRLRWWSNINAALVSHIWWDSEWQFIPLDMNTDERVYLPLYKVADTLLHIQGDELMPQLHVDFHDEIPQWNVINYDTSWQNIKYDLIINNMK